MYGKTDIELQSYIINSFKFIRSHILSGKCVNKQQLDIYNFVKLIRLPIQCGIVINDLQ